MPADFLEDSSHKFRALGAAVVMTALSAFAIWRLSNHIDQTIIAAVLAFVAIELALVSPRLGIVFVCLYVPLCGDLRRILMYSAGRADQDPLLLVAPAVLGVLLVQMFLRSQFDLSSRLSKAIAWFSILMVVQTINPLQGGPAVALAGIFFFFVPLSWYWVGQVFCTEELLSSILLRLMVPLGFIAAVYGIFQVQVGLFEFQKYWLEQTGMLSQMLGGTARAMGFFSSPQEYATIASGAILVLWAGFLTKRVKFSLLLVFPIAIGMVLAGGRGPIVVTLVTVCLMWAFNSQNRRTILLRFVFALFIGFGGLVYLLSNADNFNAPSAISPILQHHQNGILNPGESTATAHANMTIVGVLMGIVDNPVGWGIGSTTLAAARANTQVAEMEVDFSNIFLSLGVVGGVLYLVILYMIFWRICLYWKATRSFLAMAIFGLYVGWFGHFLSGLAYSVVIYAWLCVGALDGILRSRMILVQESVPAPKSTFTLKPRMAKSL